MTRLSKDDYFLNMAELVSRRSTCLRRAVGCVLVNRHDHIIATGYNGVAASMAHCNEKLDDEEDVITTTFSSLYPNACPGAEAASGTDLDACYAIHAEQNALLQCRDTQSIMTCYVTHSPCILCTKMLLNTSCARIVFSQQYPHKDAEDLWKNARRLWDHSDSVQLLNNNV